MYYLYILRSEKDGSFYTGQCKNLSERLLRHYNGYTNSTRAKRPWQLAYYETYKTRREAVLREREIKNQKSHKYIEELISNFPKDKIMGL